MYGTPLINASLSTNTQNWTISNIPQGYKHLYIIFGAKSSLAMHGPQMRWSWNNESSTNTHYASFTNTSANVYGPEAGSFRQRGITRSDAPSDLFTWYHIFIPNYSNTSIKKTIVNWNAGGFGDPLSATLDINRQANCFDNTTALTSIVLKDNWDNIWVAGSRVYIYGLSG
jgi:hypothetical protein